MRAAVEAAVAGLGLADRVRLVGFVPDAWAWMKRASVLVSPSLFEGHPNVVLEAAACGCPLVVSDIPAHREFLDGENAVLVDTGDPDRAGPGDPRGARRSGGGRAPGQERPRSGRVVVHRRDRAGSGTTGCTGGRSSRRRASAAAAAELTHVRHRRRRRPRARPGPGPARDHARHAAPPRPGRRRGVVVACDGRVGLANRRLAIIDLSPGGHQPMADARGRSGSPSTARSTTTASSRRLLERWATPSGRRATRR